MVLEATVVCIDNSAEDLHPSKKKKKRGGLFSSSSSRFLFDDLVWVFGNASGRTGDCAAVRPPPGAGPGREHAPTREKSGDSLPRPIRPPWSRPAGAKQIEAKNGNGFFFPWSVLARRESWGWEGLRRPSSRGGPHTGHSTLPLECHGASPSSASPEARSPGANNDSRREVVVSS